MEEDKVKKTSTVSIDVGVNENNVPVRRKWTAPDGSIKDAPTKAMLLSLWDPTENNTMKKIEKKMQNTPDNIMKKIKKK